MGNPPVYSYGGKCTVWLFCLLLFPLLRAPGAVPAHAGLPVGGQMLGMDLSLVLTLLIPCKMASSLRAVPGGAAWVG